MALFHTSLRVFGRAQGVSAIAAAAYRAGVVMSDARTGTTHDSSRRKGVLGVHLRAPVGAPAWALDAQLLWDHAEAIEVRRNARTARELIFCLPHELSEDARSRLALDVTQAVVDRYQVAAMVAVHAPDAHGDQRNFHGHLLFTTRVVSSEGLGKRVDVLDSRKTGPAEILWLREKVAALTNAALSSEGIAERVDHRTLKAQAAEAEAAGDIDKAAELTREPTRHQGRAATAAARRGEYVPVVAENLAKQRNHRAALAAYIRQAKSEGRLLPPSTDRPVILAAPRPVRMPSTRSLPLGRTTRATGPGAAVLNAQARQAAQTDRAPVRGEYLRGLERSMDEARRSLDQYVELTGRRHALEVWLAQTADAQALALLQRELDTHRALREAEQKPGDYRRRARQAIAERRKRQADADAHDATKPGRWAVTRKAAWERERKARWGRLRTALAAEREAQASSEGAKAAARAETARLRTELHQFETALKELALRLGPAQPPGLTPTVEPSRRGPRL